MSDLTPCVVSDDVFCRSYLPGHHTHWIHAKHVGRTPWGWRDAVVTGTLRPSDRKAPQVAASWDRLIRQVCLRKSGELGVDVIPVGGRGHTADPTARATATHVAGCRSRNGKRPLRVISSTMPGTKNNPATLLVSTASPTAAPSSTR